MTYSDLEDSLKKALENKDTVESELISLLPKIKADYDLLESYVKDRENLNQRIIDLQETNQKLFLATLSPISEDEKKSNDLEDLPQGEEVFDEYEKLKMSEEVKDNG